VFDNSVQKEGRAPVFEFTEEKGSEVISVIQQRSTRRVIIPQRRRERGKDDLLERKDVLSKVLMFYMADLNVIGYLVRKGKSYLHMESYRVRVSSPLSKERK
jgi:hypothetical protein